MHLFYFHKAKQGEWGKIAKGCTIFIFRFIKSARYPTCVPFLVVVGGSAHVFFFPRGPKCLCAQAVNATEVLFIFLSQIMSNKNQLLCCIWFEQSVSQRLKSSLTMNYKYELGAGFPTNCWEKVKHKVKCNQKENGQVKSWKSQRTWENHVGRKNDSLPPFLNYKHHENRAVFKSIIVTVII